MNVRIAVEDADEGIFVRTALHGELYEQCFPLDIEADPQGGPLKFVPACIAALREVGAHLRPAALWCHASLPAGRGFSSSAAFTLSVLDALARHSGFFIDDIRLAELAWHVEAELLRIPCGRLDPLACVAGSPAFLQWDGAQAPLRRIAVGRPVHLVLAAFPRPRDTEAILRALSERWRAPLSRPSDPSDIAAVREAISVWGSTATRAARALSDGDLYALGAAMNEAQGAYDRAAEWVPELRAPLLQGACATLHDAGALGAKFSGAGGDGSLVALAKNARHNEVLAKCLTDLGLTVWKLSLEDH